MTRGQAHFREYEKGFYAGNALLKLQNGSVLFRVALKRWLLNIPTEIGLIRVSTCQ